MLPYCWFPEKKRNDEDAKKKKAKVDAKDQSNTVSCLTDENCKLLIDFIQKLGKNFAFSSNHIYANEWICNSGVSQHMSGNLNLFQDLYTPMTQKMLSYQVVRYVERIRLEISEFHAI